MRRTRAFALLALLAASGPVSAAPFDGPPYEFPPPMTTRRVKFVGHFTTVLPDWQWDFLVNPRRLSSGDRVTWMLPHMRQGTVGDLEYKQKAEPGVRSWNQKGTYRYSARKLTGPAAEDDGSEVRLFQLNPETGLLAQGIGVVRSVADIQHDPRREWSAELRALYMSSSGEDCAAWLKTWLAPMIRDKNNPQEQYREEAVIPVQMGGMPAWSRRASYHVFTVHFGQQIRIPHTISIACLDSERGRYSLSLETTSNIFEDMFPVFQRSMDEFKLEKTDRKAELACPSDLFTRKKEKSMIPYGCVSRCPDGTHASPPGDFPYKGARVCAP